MAHFALGKKILPHIQISTLSLGLTGFACPALHAQAAPTASKKLGLTVYSGLSSIKTGLSGSRDSAFTFGTELGFRPRFGLTPSLATRASLPLGQGQVVSQKSAAAGLQLERPFGRVSLFADILVGRTQFTYPNGGRPVPHTYQIYTASAATLISPGAGFSYDVTSRLMLRVDAQMQSTSSPVTASGRLTSIPVTVAIGYRFPSEKHGHPY